MPMAGLRSASSTHSPPVVLLRLLLRHSTLTDALHLARDQDLWDLTELIDDGALIMSELVTNAARYADEIAVRVFLDAGDVVIEVQDDSNRKPLPKNPTLEDMAGRGLLLVAAYSTSWGWHPIHEGGKVTWSRMRSAKENE
jgi:anti-sigma regulatory factor (Ser/Thr protein kinase)